MRLFLYRDFISILESKYHLVVVDCDPAEQPSNLAFIEGDQRSGKTLEECGQFFDLICTLGLQSILREDGFFLVTERQDFGPNAVSVRTD